MYYDVIDPTSINKQGPDIGSQYRTGIYYIEETDKDIILNSINNLQKKYQNKIVIEVLPLINFYPAEEYHQDYLKKNPGGYCHIGQDKFDKAKKAKDNSKKNNKTLAQTCLDALYATIIAAVFVLFCMIFYAIFQDFLHSNNPIAVVMITIIDFYIQCIHFVFRGIFNCLHIFIHAIPDYSTLLSDRSFSKTAIETILYIIFHIVLFYIIKSIIRGIRHRDTD